MKAKAPRKTEPCVYCATGIASSVDHIPPQCFFIKPYPANLLTAPCCEKCRKLDEKADQHMRNLFISMDTTENHPAVLHQLAVRRNEAMRKQLHKANALLAMMKPHPINLPNGQTVTRPAFNLDHPLVDRFLERVSRGVLYTLFGTKFFQARFEWQKGQPGGFAVLPAEVPQRHISSIFSCTASRNGFVALDFYSGFPVLGKFST